MKDLGCLRYFLGLEIVYAQSGHLVCQQKYVYDIIGCACLSDDRITATSMELHQKLSTSDGEPLPNSTKYR